MTGIWIRAVEPVCFPFMPDHGRYVPDFAKGVP